MPNLCREEKLHFAQLFDVPRAHGDAIRRVSIRFK
jgi:hypothetical protein